MRKILSTLVATFMIAGLGTVATGATTAANAGGCTWYVYKTTKATKYYEYAWGSTMNRGFWGRLNKGTKLKTNEPFNGKRRTEIKYQEWYGKWQRLSTTKRYPYINKGAVRFQYCY